MKDFEEVLPKLIKLKLFSDFSAENENDRRILKSVYETMSIENYHKGDLIIREGDESDNFFILFSGSIQIRRKTPAGDSIALADLNQEQNIFFGEMSIISRDQRSATVTAKTECLTLTISGKKFLEICDAEPILGYRVLAVLARRLANTVRETNKDKAILYEALCNEIEIGV